MLKQPHFFCDASNILRHNIEPIVSSFDARRQCLDVLTLISDSRSRSDVEVPLCDAVAFGGVWRIWSGGVAAVRLAERGICDPETDLRLFGVVITTVGIRTMDG